MLSKIGRKFGGRRAAARGCNIDAAVLSKIGRLSSGKGGPQARKAEGIATELSSQETAFLTQAIIHLIIRLAQVSADVNQKLPPITLAELPTLNG